jgi:acyl-CoA thioesterase I
VGAAVIVAAAALIVVTRSPDVPSAGQTPGYVPVTPTPVTFSASPAATRSSSAAPRPVVAFLGDDWTNGRGASKPSKDFVHLIAADLRLGAHAFGTDFGGYARPGTDHRTYASLLPAVVRVAPAVVVVSGGRNDVTDYAPTMATAATAIFRSLHQQLPKATLIAIAPLWGDSDHPAKLQPIAAAVKAAVAAGHGSYWEVPDPLHGHHDWMANEADPNDRGYAALAAALVPRLDPIT